MGILRNISYRAQSIDFVRTIGPAGTLSTPGGVPGSATPAPFGFEQHPMASPPQENPQPQMGFWRLIDAANYDAVDSDDAFYDVANYFNSRPVRSKGPPNGMAPSSSRDFFGARATPISSGRFMDGWAAEAAERLSVTETMSSPQQPHSVYGNEFSAMPGGSIHPSNSMTSGAVSNRFTRQLYSVESNPPLDADKLRIWASQSPPSSDPKTPSQEILTGNTLDQSALASHPAAVKEEQQLSDKETIKLANPMQLDVHGNEAAPVPYESLYPAKPSEPSAPAVDSPDQGQDVHVDNFSPASPIPPLHEGRFVTAEQEKELLGHVYEAQAVSAGPPGGMTLNGAPLDSHPYRLLDGSGTPAAQSHRALPSPPAPTGPQSITATQGKTKLKESRRTEDVAQSASGPRPLPLPPRKSPSPPSSLDTHQSLEQTNFFLNDGEIPLPSSSSSVAKPSTAGENKNQPGASAMLAPDFFIANDCHDNIPSRDDIVALCEVAGYDCRGFPFPNQPSESISAWIKYGSHVTMVEALSSR
ncbi:hypothetical protein FS837_002147 [Tulasnella sp. UAMH 9824]|nr:hypothetical protein FS837_002147 [Tulasnella sp. UAMH 9824]